MALGANLSHAQDTLYSLSSGSAAVTIEDLCYGVESNPILMHPSIPVIAAIFYLASKPALTALCAALGTTGKSFLFRAFCLAHNLLLASYSLWTSVNVVPLTIAHFKSHGALDVYCGSSLWEDANGVKGLGFWAYLFYISKIYEIVDTYVLIVKRKKPSYLQLYHHVRLLGLLLRFCSLSLSLSRTAHYS